jgi:hypothetical protein
MTVGTTFDKTCSVLLTFCSNKSACTVDGVAVAPGLFFIAACWLQPELPDASYVRHWRISARDRLPNIRSGT